MRLNRSHFMGMIGVVFLAVTALVTSGQVTALELQGLPEQAVSTDEVAPCVFMFVGDPTIPDGTAVAPRQSFDKQWAMRFDCPTGKTSAGWMARRIIGNWGPEQIPLVDHATGQPADSGVTIIVGAQFTAPEQPLERLHRVWYRIYDAHGQRSGESFYVEILLRKN